jgi:hypothetical protein
MKKYIGVIAAAILIAAAAVTYVTAQQSGTGLPGGATNSTQFKLNGTSFGGAGPGTSGQVLTSNGAGSAPTFQAAGGTPAGSTTQVQYNNAGAFGAEAAFNYSSSTDALNVYGAYQLGLKSGTSAPTYGTLQIPNANGQAGFTPVLDGANYTAASNVRSGSIYLGTEKPPSLTNLTNPTFGGLGTLNVGIGDGALTSQTTGHGVLAIGALAGNATTDSNDLVLIGTQAGQFNRGYDSLYIGSRAGMGSLAEVANADGGQNIALGEESGLALRHGIDNTLVGWATGTSIIDGNGNVIIGSGVDGSSTYNGDRSVFIGAEAGNQETNSSRLYIDNSNTTTPLIFGRFDTNALTINGTLTTTGLVQTPASATGGAGLNVPAGTAPTSPVNGDVWTTTAGLFARINGATVGPYSAGGAALTSTQVGFGSGANALTGSSRFTYAESGVNTSTTVGAGNAGTSTLQLGTDGVTTGGGGTITVGTVSSGNGKNILIDAGSATTSGTGGSITIRSGQGAGGGNGGNVGVTCQGAGCAVDLIASSGGTGIIRIQSGGTQRIALDGSKSASTGVQFVGYGSGAITSDASGNLTAVSDERVKRNIRPYRKGLKEVETIDPILFGYTKESGLDQTKNDYAAFSAQDLEESFPEAVGHGADGLRSVDDRAIIAALVNSVKELKARVEELEAR